MLPRACTGFFRRVAGSLIVAGSLSAAGALSACVSKPADPADLKPVQASNPSAPSVAPTVSPAVARTNQPLANHLAHSIVLTPLSRVRRAGGTNPSIDLRVDALDAAGAPSRVAGQLRVKVECADAMPAECTFDIALATRVEEATYYDTTLETYVVRLEPKFSREPALGSKLIVTLELTSATGARLDARGSVAW